MRIAVFIECPPNTGGAFQQALSTIELLIHRNTTKHEFIAFTQFDETAKVLRDHDIEPVRFRHRCIAYLDMLSGTTVGGALLRRLRRLGLRRLGRHLDGLLEDHRIDLVILTDVAQVGMRIGDHPMIVIVMDIDHRDHPDYPESFTDRVTERRETWFRALLPRALALGVNVLSEGARLADLYGLDRWRMVELPFIPSSVVRRYAAGNRSVTAADVRRKYDLPACFLFYPAWYMPHKNHLYVLEALVALDRRHGVRLDAVFCGGEMSGGGRAQVLSQVRALGLARQVKVLDLLPEAEIPALYEAATAVVSPSPFGPTNLQPIESVALGRPAICADIPECREQMGDAALYCDLANPASLADQLAALLDDPDLQARLREGGERLARELAGMDYSTRLSKTLDDFDNARRRWKWPETA